MAVLDNNDYVWMRNWMQSQQTTVAPELMAWQLSKATWQGALQAIEDYMTSAVTARPATSLQVAVEAVTGSTTTIRVQYLLVVWVNWKLANFLGGV